MPLLSYPQDSIEPVTLTDCGTEAVEAPLWG